MRIGKASLYAAVCAASLLAVNASHAQTSSQPKEKAELMCGGKVTFFMKEGPQEIDVGGVFVRVAPNLVYVAGGGILNGNYVVSSINEADYRFDAPRLEIASKRWGDINRFTGKISLAEQAVDAPKMTWIFEGKCQPPKQMF